MLVGGCIVAEERCGDHQVMSTLGMFHACVCSPGYVLGADKRTCAPCGPNEQATNDTCTCSEGFSRSSPSAACTPIVGSLPGQACNDATPCAEPNPFCVTDGTESYCTIADCKDGSACPSNWRCRRSGAQTFCQKPPAGLLTACASSADCAGTEAAYCETTVGFVCLVNDCAREPSRCPNTSACCDFEGVFGQSLCVATSSLTQGKCPLGADPVAP